MSATRILIKWIYDMFKTTMREHNAYLQKSKRDLDNSYAEIRSDLNRLRERVEQQSLSPHVSLSEFRESLGKTGVSNDYGIGKTKVNVYGANPFPVTGHVAYETTPGPKPVQPPSLERDLKANQFELSFTNKTK